MVEWHLLDIDCWNVNRSHHHRSDSLKHFCKRLVLDSSLAAFHKCIGCISEPIGIALFSSSLVSSIV